MLKRFVVVPAVPKDKNSFHIGSRSYVITEYAGFDIYDNHAKERLIPTHPTKVEAEAHCTRMNSPAAET